MTSRGTVTRHEKLSSELTGRRFGDLDALLAYLAAENPDYVLKEEQIVQEAPQIAGLPWDEGDKMCYLVLLPAGRRKLFRFKVYPTADGVHLEPDFAYRNPYQS